ncbi:Z1 domain-containing protein [Plantibacter sp. T3]|uniref:Z1 domain-containing protein n=1 Tax=Plantibacter sp. T3 TaxID=2653161 RepID=UPI0012F21F53|nr:Z1 domain-containing protein [Plantibacter sp. T3]VXB08444.1 conserved hypothetical protein [Plantibacter sp. T3]
MSIKILAADTSLQTKTWKPVAGDRANSFRVAKTAGKGALPDAALQSALAESAEILAQCINPAMPSSSNAVLVVGYVQSGKTLSFTALASLARDNGFGAVVILAGTTNNLKDQSEQRLRSDLGLTELQRDWRHFPNPEYSPQVLADMKKTIDGWKRFRSGNTSQEKPAILITVLKHAMRLHSAAEILSNLDLVDVPTLVIDDESDQAGLNTKARSNVLRGTFDSSGTYEALLHLRESLPFHSYAQYTATPQANLLLAISDSLNPSFVKVIQSGDGYTGGKTFFVERKDDLIVQVPDADIFDPKEPFSEPPSSLQDALRLFLLGLAAGAGATTAVNRSMMIQAHQNTSPHATYHTWVSSLIAAWDEALDGAQPAVLDELYEEFRPAFEELSRTVSDLPPLADLLQSLLDCIRDVRVVKVNSTKDAEKQIDWKQWPYWILIGGQKLDRGFTVEGLTVTYMPRRVTENSDVLQQRARFFGYRKSYIDFCRVYLPSVAIEAFTGYVEDEEFLRESLHRHEGKPMLEWKRDFILHGQIARPTRDNVVGRSVRRIPLRLGWLWPKSMHVSAPIVLHNLELFERLRVAAQPSLRPATNIPGTVDRRVVKNKVWRDVGLDVVEDFLMSLRFGTAEDSLVISAIDMALARGTVSDLACDVIFMNDLADPTGSGRQLAVLRDNIHVGRNPAKSSTEELIYSGDASFADPSRLAVQLRLVKLSDLRPGSSESYGVVPWIALRFPRAVANDAYLENV